MACAWFAAAIVASVAAAVDVPREVVALENEAMRISFTQGADGTFSVAGISNRLAGAAFLHRTQSFPAFWGLRFVRRDAGTNVTLHVGDRRTAKAHRFEVERNTATFRWLEMSLPASEGTFDVEARVSLPPGRALSEWTIQVRNRSATWTLQSIQYPFLDRVVREDDPAATVLTPSKANVGGRLLKMPEYRANTTLFSFAYPSDRLQMAALMTGEAGVYVAAHDPECRIKTLTVAPDGTVWFETLVENAGVPGQTACSPQYPVAVGCFKGDWWTAAHIYRDWALRQRWAAKGRIAFRDDFPKKAADTHIWIIGGGPTNYAARTFAAMDAAWPGIGKNLTWSEWAVVGGGRATNRNNPEFFPAFPGIGELSRRQSEAGFLTTLYVNGRIWDKATCGFRYARRDATMKPDGTLHDEVYRSWDTNFHFAVMCPFCPDWQDTVRDLALRCLDELHMDGVYFDQIACSTPAPCYNPTHGHPLGGGRWWEQGYRSMLTEIKREFAGRGAVVISEQMGEMWLDLIDVYLNATAYTRFDVPLFPAIYSGYMVHYGRPVPLELPADEAFREYARTLAWGEAFGWIIPAVPLQRERFCSRIRLIYDMACLRRDNSDFLVWGSLEDELRPLDAVSDVYGTVWRNADGTKRCAVAVNAGVKPAALRFRFPGSDRAYICDIPPQAVRILHEQYSHENSRNVSTGTAGTEHSVASADFADRCHLRHFRDCD